MNVEVVVVTLNVIEISASLKKHTLYTFLVFVSPGAKILFKKIL